MTDICAVVLGYVPSRHGRRRSRIATALARRPVAGQIGRRPSTTPGTGPMAATLATDAAHNTAPVLRSDQDGIATLVLDRPRSRNALSSQTMAALQAEIDSIASDRSVRVLVIGANGPAFCAGHDMRELRADPTRESIEALFAQSGKLMLSLIRLPKPVIARVQGTATAAGCQLVATCDLAVASRDAKFATPGVDIGLFCSTPMVAISRKPAAQADDGDAADRRSDRRGDGGGVRPRQPRRRAGGSGGRDPRARAEHRGEIGAHTSRDRQGSVLQAGRGRLRGGLQDRERGA